MTVGARESVAGQRIEAVLRAGLLPLGLPIFVAVVALVLATLARMPPIPSDQLNYLEFARDLPDVPQIPAVYHQYQRVGLVLPLALAIKVVGYTTTAYYLVPILASVALALAVYFLGALLFNRVAGAAAAVFVVGNSAIFVDLAAPLPDLLAAALFCWAMVLTIAIRQGQPRLTATQQRRIGALVGIGVLLGWSYLTREFIVLLWPLVPLLLVRPVGTRGLAWVALPLVMIGIGELVLNAYLYEDPLARVRSVLGHGEGPMSSAALSAYRDQDRLWYANRLPEALREFPEGGWLWGFLVVTMGGSTIWPTHRLLLVWVACMAVPLSLLGGVIEPAEPMLRLTNFRYWFPIIPAIVLGGVGGAWLATRWVVGRLLASPGLRDTVAGVIAIAVVVTPLAAASEAREHDPRYVAAGAVQLDELRTWLVTGKDPVERLWADARTSRILRLIAAAPRGEDRWDGDILTLAADGAEPKPGDHVLLYSEGRGICSRCRDALERALGSPVSISESWTPVFATDDGIARVFEVAPSP